MRVGQRNRPTYCGADGVSSGGSLLPGMVGGPETPGRPGTVADPAVFIGCIRTWAGIRPTSHGAVRARF